MHIQTVQGHMENGRFFQEGVPFELPENKMLIVNILDMPLQHKSTGNPSFWDDFNERLKLSADEPLVLEDFGRNRLDKPLVVFDDGDN